MKILVNTISTKKCSGGAYQIAYNFLMKTMEYQEVEWIYVVSSDLDEILPAPMKKGMNYHVFPTQPDYRHTYKKVKFDLKVLERKEKPDVVYSITAPSYFTFEAPEVMRFTNPWVTHPNQYAWSVLSLKEKIKYYLYGLNQKRLMKNAHFFITQTETCAEGIRRITGEPVDHVRVIHNVLPAIFKKIDNTPICEDDNVNIACIGAATTHKNFDIIPDVLRSLYEFGLKNIRVHVTLPDDEPTFSIIERKAEEYGLSEMIVNHGRLSQTELGVLYKRCQLCFLPTLLEVFSASTVEAMYFQLPVVATDFNFNREVMDNACLYYEPKNAHQAAEKIREYIENEELRVSMKKKLAAKFQSYGDYEQHFNDICGFLIEVAKKTKTEKNEYNFSNYLQD